MGPTAPLDLVDAHHHLWNLEQNPCYPWLLDPVQPSHMGDYAPLQRSYDDDEYRRDCAVFNLIGSVHVEAGWRRHNPVGETGWLAAKAKAKGLPTAVVAFVDLSGHDPVPVLEAQAAFELVRGIRCMSTKDGQSVYELRPGESRIASDRFIANFPLLRRFGFSFDLQATPAILRDAAALADRVPDIPIALTHMGLPLWRDRDSLLFWRNELSELAKRPSVTVKISGLAMVDPAWTAESVAESIDIAVSLFGPHRCMLGTNFPVDKLRADPASLCRAYLQGLATLSPDERRQILSSTAAQFYGLDRN
jgi:predicted TIM-barrel fold metal-dependent hydrolase